MFQGVVVKAIAIVVVVVSICGVVVICVVRCFVVFFIAIRGFGFVKLIMVVRFVFSIEHRCCCVLLLFVVGGVVAMFGLGVPLASL